MRSDLYINSDVERSDNDTVIQIEDDAAPSRTQIGPNNDTVIQIDNNETSSRTQRAPGFFAKIWGGTKKIGLFFEPIVNNRIVGFLTQNTWGKTLSLGATVACALTLPPLAVVPGIFLAGGVVDTIKNNPIKSLVILNVAAFVLAPYLMPVVIAIDTLALGQIVSNKLANSFGINLKGMFRGKGERIQENAIDQSQENGQDIAGSFQQQEKQQMTSRITEGQSESPSIVDQLQDNGRSRMEESSQHAHIEAARALNSSVKGDPKDRAQSISHDRSRSRSI